MEIGDALSAIQLKIAEAKKDGGILAGDGQLIAVSKTRPVEDVEAALEAGQRLFGENRVQEAEAKFPGLRPRYPDLKLHLIGPLQSNKAKEAVALFDVIETIDRPKIAAAIAKEMAAQGRQPGLFVQVNTGEEPQKAGVLPGELGEFLTLCCKTHGLTISGLMCIPPVDEAPAPHFEFLRQLAEKYKLPKLSMGMSADYETAVQMGADYVRVGTAIFGARG
ncbi:MAG: YggS family pyridoxal phosphate enzyme [Rhodomicrobium sp.]|nr:MAG: YggS family pyridoxal phosphate enzyme [Rhodomicrobium sp.]